MCFGCSFEYPQHVLVEKYEKKNQFCTLIWGAWFVLLSIYISIVVVLDKTQPFTSADPGGVGWGGVGCWAEGGGG